VPKNYYEILGIAENASDAELKKAYRRLAKKYHPDTNQGDKTAEDKFKEVSEAYDVLSDPRKRSQYDQMRKFGGGFHPGGGRGGFGGFDFAQGNGVRFSFEDLGGFGSLGDIFSSIFGDRVNFGRRAQRRQSTAPRKGNNLAATVEISFAEMAKGVSKTIRLRREANCEACGGTGSEPGAAKTVCPQCNGRGVVSQPVGSFSVSRPCPRCLGTGQTASKQCQRCGGTGRQPVSQKVSIRVPPGVENGARLRLKNLGQPGVNGGPNGDLIVTVKLRPDRFFTRVGKDILCTVPISLKQAFEGARIKVRTLEGHAIVRVPPLSRDGTKFSLKGLGISQNGAKGNQYVIVTVQLPEKPSDDELAMIRKLEEKVRDRSEGKESDS
jgi:molecular chaperone DnaJ